ncbi:RNA-binding domain-containing protein [Cryptosporidium felis]|nr:RNA-binding domain-containing protein [Cryptosporidium felis]
MEPANQIGMEDSSQIGNDCKTANSSGSNLISKSNSNTSSGGLTLNSDSLKTGNTSGGAVQASGEKMALPKEDSVKADIEDSMMDTDFPGSADDEEMRRSIYIGNVDYGTKLTELQDLFKGCGSINRITIMNDKRTGMPKGFAYLEFCEPEAVETALKFDGAMFRGRQIKVSTKRKNIPGYNRGRGGAMGGVGFGPIGGGFRGMGRGGFRGGYSRGGMMSVGPGPNMRGYYGNPYKSYRGGGSGGYSGNSRHIVNPY